jgi:hypothetical protein
MLPFQDHTVQSAVQWAVRHFDCTAAAICTSQLLPFGMHGSLHDICRTSDDGSAVVSHSRAVPNTARQSSSAWSILAKLNCYKKGVFR